MLFLMIKMISYSNGQQRWILVISFVAIATVLASTIASSLHTSCAMAATSQAYSWKNVVTGGGGGFVVDIIFNQKQKDLIYARTDVGGAYRWNPSTSTWTQLLGW